MAPQRKRCHSQPVQAMLDQVCPYDNTLSRNGNIEQVINTLLVDSHLITKKIEWGKDKLDIILVNTVNGTEVSPNSDELDSFHRSLYAFVENNAHLSLALESLDITVGSPGIGDVLQTDRDFESFEV